MSSHTPPDHTPAQTAPAAARTRRVLALAIAVFAVNLLLTLASHVWDWAEVVAGGEPPEHDEWLDLVGLLWLPIVAVTVYRLTSVYRELTEKVNEALGAFHDTVQTAHGWVWRVDNDQRIVYSSPGVRELLGYEADEVIGHDPVDLLVLDEDREQLLADMLTGRVADGWQNWQTRLRHRDGSVRHVRSSATPVYGRDGQLLAYQGFTTDVTAEVAAIVAEQAGEMRRLALRTGIEHIIRTPEALEIFFQPIVDVTGQRIAGVEALSRFAGQPYRPPNVWFDEAWQAGLGPDLELHAIDLACRQLPSLPPGAYLSVNAAPETILDDRFERLLAGLGPAAGRIVVEVTEHAAVSDYDTLARAVERLRRTGVRFAVDDAGAGYSSMQHVLRLRPDVIKLDRGIVADIDNDAARRALVTAMAGFAESLGMTVVAEGIETGAELAVLTDAGVRHAQGYFLARPSADPAPTLTRQPAESAEVSKVPGGPQTR